MRWFEQHKNFQLGDFIMLTSGLKALSDVWKESINVFFNTKVVKSLYLDCDFINILNKKPSTKPFESSIFSSYNYGNYRRKRDSKKESMQRCFFRSVAVSRGYSKPMPHTYVDKPDGIKLNRKDGLKYVAVFHGCLGKQFISKKSIPMDSLSFILAKIVESGHIPVVLGSKSDFDRFWRRVNKPAGTIDYVSKLPIRDSVSILSQCDNFISNDTGLYHVASALKKDGLVLWNNTDHYKNAPSHTGVKIFLGKKKEAKDFNKAISSCVEGL